MTFNPQDWYWKADDGRIFASARQIIVDDTDSDYLAFIGLQMATDWPRDLAGNQTDATLQDVLTPYGLYSTLNGYAGNARYNKASGGCVIGGQPYLTDPVARNTVDSAHTYAVANPGHITDWKLADGTFTPLTEAQLANVLQLMATFVQACFTCESNTVAGINGGTITTHAQIDSAFAAISNVLS